MSLSSSVVRRNRFPMVVGMVPTRSLEYSSILVTSHPFSQVPFSQVMPSQSQKGSLAPAAGVPLNQSRAPASLRAPLPGDPWAHAQPPMDSYTPTSASQVVTRV